MKNLGETYLENLENLTNCKVEKRASRPNNLEVNFTVIKDNWEELLLISNYAPEEYSIIIGRSGASCFFPKCLEYWSYSSLEEELFIKYCSNIKFVENKFCSFEILSLPSPRQNLINSLPDPNRVIIYPKKSIIYLDKEYKIDKIFYDLLKDFLSKQGINVIFIIEENCYSDLEGLKNLTLSEKISLTNYGLFIDFWGDNFLDALKLNNNFISLLDREQELCKKLSFYDIQMCGKIYYFNIDFLIKKQYNSIIHFLDKIILFKNEKSKNVNVFEKSIKQKKIFRGLYNVGKRES